VTVTARNALSRGGFAPAIIQNPTTWEASGHVAGFNDPMVDCKESKGRYRADHVKVYVPKDDQGNSYAFIDDQEAADKKIKRDARRNPTDYDVVVLTTLPTEAYAKIVGP